MSALTNSLSNSTFNELLDIATGRVGFFGDAQPVGTPLQDLDEVVAICLLAFLSGKVGNKLEPNHVLLEGTIGTGKTVIASNVNNVILGPALYHLKSLFNDDKYARISGNPDLRPQDIVGGDVLGSARKITFRRGPILKNDYLMFYADELNRAPSRTQNVLLEAMQERAVTITTIDDSIRTRRKRLSGFFMFASQNPLKDIGTNPLPEAQLDRFLVMLNTPLPTNAEDIMLPERADDEKSLVEHLYESMNAPHGSFETSKWEHVHELLREMNSNAKKSIRLPTKLDTWLKQITSDASTELTLTPDGEAEEEDVTPTRRRLRKLSVMALKQLRFDEIDAMRGVVSSVEFSRQMATLTKLIWTNTWSETLLRSHSPNLIPFLSRDNVIRDVTQKLRRGASPRALLAIRDLSKSIAWARDKDAVDVDDIVVACKYTLRHRVVLRDDRDNVDELIRKIVSRIVKAHAS